MRILIVTQLFYPDTIGGSERTVYEQARGLARRGHEVTVVVQRARTELPDMETIDGVRVIRYGHSRRQKLFGMSHTDLTAGVSVLKSLLGKETFSVAILHHPFPALAYFRSSGARAIPALYVFHASVYRELVFEKKLGRPIGKSLIGTVLDMIASPLLLSRVRKVERSAILKSQRVAVLSEFSKRLVMETYGVPEESIVLIPGGVDLDTYRPHPSPRALRTRLGLPADRTLLLTVRRLVPRMGIEELIAATAELLRTDYSIQLLVGGSGPDRERLVRAATKLGISRSVTFLGQITPRDLPDYYAAADLFVMPTVAFEGSGIATLEALASGTPVVGTPAGATPELLSRFDPALVSEAATPAALAACIRAYLDRPPADRADLRQKARALAEAEYPWSRSVDMLENELVGLTALVGPDRP